MHYMYYAAFEATYTHTHAPTAGGVALHCHLPFAIAIGRPTRRMRHIFSARGLPLFPFFSRTKDGLMD